VRDDVRNEQIESNGDRFPGGRGLDPSQVPLFVGVDGGDTYDGLISKCRVFSPMSDYPGCCPVSNVFIFGCCFSGVRIRSFSVGYYIYVYIFSS